MSSTPLLEAGAQPLLHPLNEKLQTGPGQGQDGGQGGEVVSMGSLGTQASRPPQLPMDPQASRRVCFYKSGDPQFRGHRMVINARTFKTFDALLDALSKKVPLPFGVRTITTPRGTHPVRCLEDLQDGGSYICSDQRKVKPLNLDMANRRQPPWNNPTRQVSGRRRAFPGGRGVARPAESRVSRVSIRTPKRLIVFKNRDPSVRRTVVLQRRTAPTYDALLDHLSGIMQFPVLKLYTPDGSRVDGLLALILCSGVVVAAGNEPFRQRNYDVMRTAQPIPPAAQSSNSDSVEPTRLQPLKNKTSFSSGRRSRNFSLSSEKYFVNQINKSVNGSSYDQPVQSESMETDLNQRETMRSVDIETESIQQVVGDTTMVPQDDDIEKSFRVNQDGSMTVEMKVRLTIKEEEMIHWTTTLSRSSVVTTHKSGTGLESTPQSPENNVEANNNNNCLSSEKTNQNHPSQKATMGVTFSGTDGGGTDSGDAGSLKAGPNQKRALTPGLRQVKKKQASMESVTTVTDTGVQETSLETFFYTERIEDRETTEGYCVVHQSSSSSSKIPHVPPIPMPRKSGSTGVSRTSRTGSYSNLQSPGVAEVMQIQTNDNGREITEKVIHIHERRQSIYDNYYANAMGAGYATVGLAGVGCAGEVGNNGGYGDHSTPMPWRKPASTDSGPCSSVDFTQQSSSSTSLNREREDMLSLSSEPTSPSQNISPPEKLPDLTTSPSNNLSTFTKEQALSGAFPKEKVCSESKELGFSETEELQCSEKKELECSVTKELQCSEKKELECSEKKELECSEKKELECSEKKELEYSEKKELEYSEIREFECPETKELEYFETMEIECSEPVAKDNEDIEYDVLEEKKKITLKQKSPTSTTSSKSRKATRKTLSPVNTEKNCSSSTGSEKVWIITETDRVGQRSRNKKTVPEKNGTLALNINVKDSEKRGIASEKQLNIGENVSRRPRSQVNNSESSRQKAQPRKKVLDITPPRQTVQKANSQPTRKILAKQRSMSNEDRTKSPKQTQEMSESVSLPVFHHPPPDIFGVHQYVENWLLNITPESSPYVPFLEEGGQGGHIEGGGQDSHMEGGGQDSHMEGGGQDGHMEGG
uniref:Doublecortin domain-containing protein n=2 Tax=Esox lucius TaxID=8010 RepID=A0A3P8XSZ7_ESOLU